MSKNTKTWILGIIIVLLVIGLILAVSFSGVLLFKFKEWQKQLQNQSDSDDDGEEELPEVECPMGQTLGNGANCKNLWNCCKDGYACTNTGWDRFECEYQYPSCQNVLPINWTYMDEQGWDYSDVEANLTWWEGYYVTYDMLNGKWSNPKVDYAYEMVDIDAQLHDFPCQCGDGTTERFVYVHEDTITGSNPTTYYTGTPFTYMYCFQNQ